MFFLSLSEQVAPEVATLSLGTPLILVFALVTVFITATGYLINDYFDLDSDRLNKKEARLTKVGSYLYSYWILNLVGFVLALWLAYSLEKIYLSSIYLVAVCLLYLYSARWKKKVLIGNIVVAVFSAFVIVILIYAEKEILFKGGNLSRHVLMLMVHYSIFVFLISMVREIIKDIEDIKGDTAVGYQTLPIVYGIPWSRKIAASFNFVLLLMLSFWCYYLYSKLSLPVLFLIIVALYLPCLYLFYNLTWSRRKSASYLSRYCKYIMLVGLAVLVILRFTLIIS